MEMVEAIPLALEIAREDGLSFEMIPRNTQVPFNKTQRFYTSENDQQGMSFEFF